MTNKELKTKARALVKRMDEFIKELNNAFETLT